MAISDATTETIDSAKSDTTTERGVARRGLMAGALAGIAALFVGKSNAAAQEPRPFLLETKNQTGVITELEEFATAVGPALHVSKGVSKAQLGGAPADLGRYPVGDPKINEAAVYGGTEGQIGVLGISPTGVGVWAASDTGIASWGVSLRGNGVLGQTHPSGNVGFTTGYPAAGVLGIGDAEPGTLGKSASGPGGSGQSDTGVGLLGQTGRALPAVQYAPAGVLGIGGENTGVWGKSTSGIGAWGTSDTNVGVLGQTYMPTGGNVGPALAASRYPAAGVLGIGHSGRPGSWGMAMGGGVGSWGTSDTGQGVIGQTGVAVDPGPTQYPPSGVLGIARASGSGVIGWIGTPDAAAAYPRSAVLGIGNQGEVGLWGVARGGGIASWAQADTGVAVSGESGNIGGWFKTGNVQIDPKTLEKAALHTTALGTDVSGCFRAEMGVAVMAEASDEKGTALMAMGRIQSDMVGFGAVAAGADASSIVPCALVNRGITHVDVTVQSDIGAQVAFVEILTGVGFIVHFDRKARMAGTFSYFTVEAMQHEHR